MHSFAIALAYLAMIFTPCAVATWGDLLVMPRLNLFGAFRRRQRAVDPVLLAIQQAQLVADLAREAFTEPATLPVFGTAPATFAAALQATSQRDAFAAASTRVAARLAQMVAAHQQALQAAADAIAAETRAAEAVLFPQTPTASELDALYAPHVDLPEPVFAILQAAAPDHPPTLQMPNHAVLPLVEAFDAELDFEDTQPVRIAA